MKLKIKEIIKSKGLTLQDVADKIGVARMTLANTLQKNNPTISTLEKIADALGVSVFDLFEDDRVTSVCPHCGKPIKIKIEG